MRTLLSWLLLLTACAEPSTEAHAFLEDASFRRERLEASLANPDNGYSALRIANYDEWSALPEWNPPVRQVHVGDIGRFVLDPAMASDESLSPAYEAPLDLSHDALMATGQHLFENFPLGTDGLLGMAVAGEDEVEAAGLWQDPRGLVGGLVRVQVAGGREAFAPTCSTCHARVEDGALVHGAANVDFRYGAVGPTGIGPSFWGDGRLDVTPDDSNNPVAIGDLRPIRFQTRLHRAGTVRNDLIALALRIETLLITSYGERLRPPREVAYALAYYLWNLAPESNPDLDARGYAVYASTCERCHGLDTPSREVVSFTEVGTDPAVGLSSTRTTGGYRVPTLVGVRHRPRLLNTGEAIDLPTLLSPESDPLGHPFGRTLSDDDKRLLVDFLQTL